MRQLRTKNKIEPGNAMTPLWAALFVEPEVAGTSVRTTGGETTDTYDP